MLQLLLLSLSWIFVRDLGVSATGSPCLLSVSGVLCKKEKTKNGTVQLIHKLVPLETVDRMYPAAPVNGTWKCVKPACLSSPCVHGGNCTETDVGFECECPKGFGGQRCEIYPPRNCDELKARGDLIADGMYVIDPDGEHRHLASPIEMECVMASGITNVPHDITSQVTTPYDVGVGEYVRNVTYPYDSNTILALIQNSRTCSQHISATGYRSYIYATDGTTQNVWWVSRQGWKMPNWGDTPSDHKGCSCSYITPSHTYNTCTGGRRCHIDYSDGNWRSDAGYLTDRDRLPVIRLYSGYTQWNYRSLYYSLGPLECSGYWS